MPIQILKALWGTSDIPKNSVFAEKLLATFPEDYKKLHKIHNSLHNGAELSAMAFDARFVVFH
jgi:hypothetical protein